MNFVIQIFYLLLANSGRFIIPILFLPISSRLLESPDFEALSVTISFATWIAVVIEYGFNYSAAKKIKYNSSKEKVLAVVNATLSAKLILSLLGIVLGIYTAYYVGKKDFLFIVFFWLYSFFVGAMFSFVYICKNNNRKLLEIEFIGALVFLLLIVVIWFKGVSDFYAVLGALVFYRGVIFILSVKYIKSHVGVLKIRIKFGNGLRAIKKSFAYALFQISSSIYLYGLSLIASMLIDKNIIIYHLLAERIFKLITLGFAPVSRVAFSLLNNFKGSKKTEIIFMLCIFAIASGFAGLFFLQYLSIFIITSFYGQVFIAAHTNLNLLAIALPFAFLNGIMSVSGFLSEGRMKYLNAVIVITGILIVPVCYLLVLFKPVLAASLSYVIAEAFITVMLLMRFIPYFLKSGREG